MIRRQPRTTQRGSSAASDVYKKQAKVTGNRWRNTSDDAVMMPNTLQDSQHYQNMILEKYLDNVFPIQNLRKVTITVTIPSSWICPTGSTANSVNAILLSARQGSIQNYAASKRFALPIWTWCDKPSPPIDLGNSQEDKTSSSAADYLTPAVNRQPGHRRGNSPSFRELLVWLDIYSLKRNIK